jgi:ethanolamine phosphate transferase 2 subunit G
MLAGTGLIFKISMAHEAGETIPIWLQRIPQAWSWTPSLVGKARVTFISMFTGILWYSGKWIASPPGDRWISGAFPFINLFLLGQSRYANIPLFLLFEAQRRLLGLSGMDEIWTAMTCLWMQHVSFFALGNSNSLSSVDLTNAYNGLSSYSIPLVGLLTFISNWAGPIWWIFAAVQSISSRGVYVRWIGLTSLFHGVVMCFLVAACIILRTHLFIWTVFSPKFLFQAAWMALAHVVVESAIGIPFT